MKYKVKVLCSLVGILFIIPLAIYGNPLDSIRIDIIKGKRHIIHKVDKGQGLYAIARRYNVDVQQIMHLNPEKVSDLKVNDLIMIPVFDTVIGRLKRSELSESGNVNEGPKKEKNEVDSAVKKTAPAPIEEVHANSRDMKDHKLYTVLAGETLSRIGLRYKVPVASLMKWNGLKNTRVEVGQELIIQQAISINPYEKWNAPNSLTGQAVVPPHFMSNAEVIEQTGFATVGSGAAVLHATAPGGALILITDLDTGKQCYAKVTGTSAQNVDHVLIVNSYIKEELNSPSDLLRVNIKYIIP